jgi:hypothetical protein
MISLSSFSELRAALANPYGDLARPDRLPKPACRVMLICGPPAAGKSTYVREHAREGDTVIDFDDIAREFGYGRNRPPDVIGQILLERNHRLAALAGEPVDRTAWIIIGSPSARMRAWWCDQLGVKNYDLVLLVPTREELFERIKRDPERRSIMQLQTKLVLQWFQRERDDRPSRIIGGCDADGWPSDPLHLWNRDD